MRKAKHDTKELEAANKELQAASKKLAAATKESETYVAKEHTLVVNVCKMPGPPAPFVPVPYPEINKSRKASDGKVKLLKKCQDGYNKASKKVAMVLDKQSVTLKKKMKSSSGDEAGTIKGLISATNMDKAKVMMGVSKVKVEGTKIIKHLQLTRQASEKQFKIIDKKTKKKH